MEAGDPKRSMWEQMIAIVITGAPGIGKTTLLPLVADALGDKGAFLDGDDVGHTRPLDRTKERLDVIQDNIGSCADNFSAWGARHFIAAYVFPSQERIDRIVTRLRDSGHRSVAVGLIAEEEVLIERHRSRPEDYGTDPECLRDAAGCNAGIRQLQGVHPIDTTSLSIDDVAKAVVDYCRNIEQRAGV